MPHLWISTGRRPGLLGSLTIAMAALVAPAAAAPPTPGEDLFERRVRPVFAEHCVGCHGPKTAKANLRLDSRAGLAAGAESGAVVTPGDPDDSPLVEAVRRTGAVKMPPKQALGAPAVADIVAWVRLGAPWPDGPRGTIAATTKPAAPGGDPGRDHWAFRPVREPAAPTVGAPGWCRASVDRFVLAGLDARGLAPSPEADRRTLIRRLRFDLTGLPPTPEEVAAFQTDARPDAYERLVDRLLASPAYGERWGRLWLDVARYSDTKGYVFFEDGNFPWAYTYRDYVVAALNADLPYDRFLIEQLAADRLPEARGRTLAALGFLSLGGRFMNNPHDIIDDRIDVVTRGLMGLTITCARCHDHKYDPFPSTDYYALYGVFASTVEPDVPPLLDPPPETPSYRAFETELKTREAKLEAFLAEKRAALAASAKSRVAEYLLAARAAQGQPTTEEFMLLADGNDLNPTMLIRWRAYLDRTRRRADSIWSVWHALSGLPDDRFTDRAAAVLAEFAAPNEPNGAARAAAPNEPNGVGGRVATAAPRIAPNEPNRPINPRIAGALKAQPPRSMADVAAVYSRLLNEAEAIGQEHRRKAALEGRAPGPLPVDGLDDFWRVLHGPDAPPEFGPTELSNLQLLPDRPAQGVLQNLEKAVATWRATGPGAPPRAMSLADAPRLVEPRVFLRGNPNNPGAAVPRRFLAALSPGETKPFTNGSGRLELARAIATADNPLTARVLVNRVWLHHFGTPLVATPGDFGLRSDPPSNPALLDHLAYQFSHGDGWSLKALHRRIVLSATYRQSSDDRSEARAVDPENLLLWRFQRRRLDFESLRDAVLAVAGRLDPTRGGPPFADVATPPSTTARPRRTLYAKVDRLNLPGLFRTFDFPDPNATSPRRDATTVAPQALFLMNHPFLLAAARALLTRPDVAALSGDDARVARLHLLLYGRPAAPEELALAHRFLADPDGGWERYAQVLLLSNEFAFID